MYFWDLTTGVSGVNLLDIIPIVRDLREVFETFFLACYKNKNIGCLDVFSFYYFNVFFMCKENVWY